MSTATAKTDAVTGAAATADLRQTVYAQLERLVQSNPDATMDAKKFIVEAGRELLLGGGGDAGSEWSPAVALDAIAKLAHNSVDADNDTDVGDRTVTTTPGTEMVLASATASTAASTDAPAETAATTEHERLFDPLAAKHDLVPLWRQDPKFVALIDDLMAVARESKGDAKVEAWVVDIAERACMAQYALMIGMDQLALVRSLREARRLDMMKKALRHEYEMVVVYYKVFRAPSALHSKLPKPTLIQDVGVCWNPKCTKDLGEKPPLLRCARCKRVFYCDTKCQSVHWAVHKPTCDKVSGHPKLHLHGKS